MALHINNQNDLNEMFDKFATVPVDENLNRKVNDPKKKQDSPEAKADTEPKTGN